VHIPTAVLPRGLGDLANLVDRGLRTKFEDDIANLLPAWRAKRSESREQRIAKFAVIQPVFEPAVTAQPLDSDARKRLADRLYFPIAQRFQKRSLDVRERTK
jgi:hypothetical protein